MKYNQQQLNIMRAAYTNNQGSYCMDECIVQEIVDNTSDQELVKKYERGCHPRIPHSWSLDYPGLVEEIEAAK